MGKLSYRIVIAAIFILSLAAAEETAAQGHPSARVEALGGEAMTGIVRDTLTDIYLHPAFLASCDRLTINYGQRQSPALYLELPKLGKYTELRRDYGWGTPYYGFIESQRSNEVILYGFELGEWKLAASAEWRIDYQEISKPAYSDHYSFLPEINQSNGYLTTIDNKRYMRADITIARRLSESFDIGIRLGGITSRAEEATSRASYSYRYYLYEDPYELVPEYERYSYDQHDEIMSFSGLFAQIGLLSSSEDDFRGVDLKIARCEIYYRNLDQRIGSRTYYDSYGEIDEYSRSDTKYRDERYGTMWRYDLMGRLAPRTDLRLYAGVSFEHVAYDTEWKDIYDTYGWDDYFGTDWDGLGTMEFNDKGDYTGLRAFFKIGKAKELMEELEITAGLCASFKKLWSEEKPIAQIAYYSVADGSLLTLHLEKPLEISTDRIEAGISIPIAIDFEPANWISIWTGFMLYANYRRLDDAFPHIDIRNLENITSITELEELASPCEYYRLDNVYVSSTAKVGVSLHYKEKFFVDLYTGSDLTPDNLANYIIDVRYAF
jgi:hypothetical protein